MLASPSRPWLIAELLLLTVAFPVALLELHLQKFLLPGLWAVMIYCLMVRREAQSGLTRTDWRWDALNWQNLRPILLRFLICAAALTGLTWMLIPQNFLSFVRSTPGFWALVMVLYPILSVIAQEIIYRWFFFARYAPLFPNPRIMILASAATFGFGHIVLNNWIAPLLCVIGGLIFAATYQRHRSLSLVTLEHALYGNFIFTIGLGWYFYHGSQQFIKHAVN